MEKKITSKFDGTIFENLLINELVLLLITGILLFGVKVSFGNGDEYAIAFSMAGGFGFDMSHLVYATVGPIFGLLETALGVIFRGGSVYICTLVALSFLAANNIFLVFKKFRAEWYGYVILWAAYAYMIISINYSLVTIFLSGSALFLAYAAGNREKADRLSMAMILVSLIFVGSLRYPLCLFSLLCVVAYAFPYSKKISLKPLVISGIFLIFVIGLNNAINMAICHSSGVSAQYMAWYDKSVGFRDFPDVDYNRYKDLFDAVGYSSNDVDMLNHWCFDDLTVFTTEKMGYVLAGIPIGLHYNLNVKHVIKELIETPIVWISLALFIMVLLSILRKQEKISLTKAVRAVAILCPFAVIMVGLAVRQRIYPHIFMPFVLLIILEYIVFVQRENAARYAFAVLALILILFWDASGIADMKTHNERSSVYGEYIAQNMDKTFLIDNSAISYMTESATPIVEKSRYQLYPNLVTMSDFDTSSPRDLVKLDNAGISDWRRPYLSLLDESVYYIGREDGKQLEYLRIYFKEHYDLDVDIETIHDFAQESNIRVYKFN